MGRPLSPDLRERVVGAVLGGLSCHKVSARFGVSVSSAIRWVSALRSTGSFLRRPMGGDRRSKSLETHARIILAAVDQMPDITIEELRALLAEHDVSASHGAVWNLLARHGLTVKKKTAHASEQERADVVAAREAWHQMQQGLDPFRLVFLDESGVKTNMARRRGRSGKGKRLVASIPHGHWKSLTFIAGLRADRINAPWVLDRAMNGDAFLIYLQEILGPTLAKGDTVIMDNLSTHKVAGVRDAIEATGAKLLYLPPYSPDLNPIEMMFAKLKALLRKAAKRTIDGLWQAIGDILNQFTPQECRNYLKKAGYDST
jgi:transposase